MMYSCLKFIAQGWKFLITTAAQVYESMNKHVMEGTKIFTNLSFKTGSRIFRYHQFLDFSGSAFFKIQKTSIMKIMKGVRRQKSSQ